MAKGKMKAWVGMVWFATIRDSALTCGQSREPVGKQPTAVKFTYMKCLGVFTLKGLYALAWPNYFKSDILGDFIHTHKE